MEFSYQVAFSRMIGLVSEQEQDIIKQKKIAIVGMGGVGANHLICLVRLGFSRFNICDFDHYDWSNINRQYGANTKTIGKSKVETMAEMAREINPEVEIEIFDKPISKINVKQFLDGVDLFVDGVDAFEVSVRRLLFMEAYSQRIFGVTAGPIGFSSAFIVFDPSGVSFDQYFRIDDEMDDISKFTRFLVGLTPKATHRSYMDLSKVDLKKKTGPSVSSACFLSSAIIGTNAIKILLKRGDLKPAPFYHQFDPYLNTYICKRLWFSNGHFLQRYKIRYFEKFLRNLGK